MPRNITVTFQDGTSHVYQNAPDDVTPEQVTERAQQEFGQPVTALDGGRQNTPAPKPAPQVVSREDAIKAKAREQVAAEQARRDERLQIGDKVSSQSLGDLVTGTPNTDKGFLADLGDFGASVKASAANTFGIGPRIQAGISALKDDVPYQDALTYWREVNKAERDQSLTGNITGALVGGGGIAKGAGSIVSRVAQSGVPIAQQAGNFLQKITTLQPGQKLGNALKIIGIGGASGAGQAAGEGTDIGEGAALGAAGGAVVGYAAPKVVNAIEAGVSKVASLIPALKGRPSAQVVKILMTTLQQDGLSADDAAAVLSEAQARGVPLSLSDVGENIRGLTSSLARKPGKNRPIVMDAVEGRQFGQAERIQGAIQRDLGPVTNPREASLSLIKSAREKAGPLYEQAYAAPVDWTKDEGVLLNKIINTPAGKKALQNAHTIAGNEMRDPGSLGFAMDDAGNVTLESVPTFQTLDYVKRGLDNVISGYPKDIRTGRPALDENGLAIDKLRRTLVEDLRKRNPAYEAALDAYAGDAAMSDALLMGQKAVSKSADDIASETARMTEPELEQYKLGVRSGLTAFLEGKPDGANQVRALLGTPKKRAALEKLFGGQEGLSNFISTLKAEAETYGTYARSMTGSPTAINMADDQNMEKVVDLFDAGINAGSGRFMNAARILLKRKGGADKLSAVTREELARAVTETDPRTLRAIMRSIGDAEIQSVRRLQRAAPLAATGGAAAARDNEAVTPPPTEISPQSSLNPAEDQAPELADLVSRVEQQESGGNQSAVSPKGAIGVMQIMPTTAPEAAALAGVPFDENALRTDAEYNRHLGTAYLEEMLRRFDGNKALALAAYNAGPATVEKALAKNKGSWFSLMPKETRDYVRAIL